MIGCGIVALIFSLMLVWWLALPVCIGMVCLGRMHEKTEIMLYFRKKEETVEDRKDPIAHGSWFNGQTLSDITLSYYSTNHVTTPTEITYKQYEQTNLHLPRRER